MLASILGIMQVFAFFVFVYVFCICFAYVTVFIAVVFYTNWKAI